MHRTQIYFDEDILAEIKKASRQENLSMSAYIRKVLKQELINTREKKLPVDFSNYSGLWQDYDINQKDIRSKAWK